VRHKHEHLIPFTNEELEAIYGAIEEASPRDDPRVEDALERVIHKITPAEVGDPKPEGARVAPQYFETADGTLIVFIPRTDEGVVDVHCHGTDDHFREPDGGCVHTDQILAAQSGEYAPIRVLGYRGYGSRAAMEAKK
jgi:hypothetical protein